MRLSLRDAAQPGPAPALTPSAVGGGLPVASLPPAVGPVAEPAASVPRVAAEADGSVDASVHLPWLSAGSALPKAPATDARTEV